MLAKRIIPCLDVRNGKVVKGVNFEGIRDVGDPVECAEEYNKQGADEIVFYDITASFEGRGVFLDVVRETAKKVFVPLTVGGGIKNVDDIRETLRAGADKVSVNSQAVKNPQLIKDGADIFGSQCICVGIDAKKIADRKWTVYINGGRVDMQLDLIEWVKKVENLGAGEICLNSIDADGTKEGFDIEMLKAVCGAVNIPVIASGGAGKIDDFSEVFEKTGATAALAASLFHFKELTVQQVKEHCRNKGEVIYQMDKVNNMIKTDLNNLDKFFAKGELIPAICYEVNTKTVLMLAYMNKESLKKTLETGYTWFWSRSRQEYWNKGATSGHLQKVVSIYGDCDNDTLLVNVEQTGVACHTGEYSCFFNEIYNSEE